jgi:hypothetical protein
MTRTGFVSDCARVGDEGMGRWLLSRQRRRTLRFASSTGVLTCTDTITLRGRRTLLMTPSCMVVLIGILCIIGVSQDRKTQLWGLYFNPIIDCLRPISAPSTRIFPQS